MAAWVRPRGDGLPGDHDHAGVGLPNRAVNCLPLSVSTSSGTPNSSSADANARQTARPVARRTTDAITQYREWSPTALVIVSVAMSSMRRDMRVDLARHPAVLVPRQVLGGPLVHVALATLT